MDLADLIARRGRLFTAIDDILNTAAEAGRDLTAAERAEHDVLVRQADELTKEIDQARANVGHGLPVPHVNRIGTAPPGADRSLNELLWATAETVEAGTISENGVFTANPYGARNPVEQVVVRTEAGVTVTEAPRITTFRPEQRPLVRAFQETVADMVMFGLVTEKRVFSSAEAFEVARNHVVWRDRWQYLLRALGVDTGNEGANWVPTGIGATMHERVRAMGRVAPLFPTIDLPTNPWKWPVEGADAIAYRVAEPTSDTATKVTASTPGTLQAVFDAEILGARTLFSRSMDADSAVTAAPFIRNKLARAHAIGIEQAILDGDSDGTHQDSDVGASTTDARTLWDGLRKRGLANAGVDGGNTAVTLALFREARAAMGRWGIDPSTLAAIVSMGVYLDLLALPETTTVDKYGDRATVINGELAKLDGIPIIVSEHAREDLNASGVHDGVTTNRTYLALVNRGEFAIGVRMALDVEVDDSIYRESFQRVAVAFQRLDFQPIGDAASNDDVAILFNLT